MRGLGTFRKGGGGRDVGGDDAAGAAAADGAADAGGSDADEDMRFCAQSEYVTPVTTQLGSCFHPWYSF